MGFWDICGFCLERVETSDLRFFILGVIGNSLMDLVSLETFLMVVVCKVVFLK